MATKKPTKGKVGRPRAQVVLTPITTNYAPNLLAAIERARVRRQKAAEGKNVTTSDAIRMLLLKAITAEEAEEASAGLPTTTTLESTTKKS